jgi:hypothetical protein
LHRSSPALQMNCVNNVASPRTDLLVRGDAKYYLKLI